MPKTTLQPFPAPKLHLHLFHKGRSVLQPGLELLSLQGTGELPQLNFHSFISLSASRARRVKPGVPSLGSAVLPL